MPWTGTRSRSMARSKRTTRASPIEKATRCWPWPRSEGIARAWPRRRPWNARLESIVFGLGLVGPGEREVGQAFGVVADGDDDELGASRLPAVVVRRAGDAMRGAGDIENVGVADGRSVFAR